MQSGDIMKCADICEENIIHRENVKIVKDKSLSEEEVLHLSELFKALSDSTRIKILHALSIKELCVCDISNIVGMSQSAISHQLRLLRNMRLVKYRKEGKVVYYSLNDNHVVNIFGQGIEHVRHN